MASLNKVMLIGNLTRDPDLRVTPKGTAICQFGIAVNRTFKSEDGTTKDEVTFLDVEAWGKQGETIAKYLVKGKPIFIEGRLKLDQWEDKTSGDKRSKVKVVLEQFQFLGGRDDAAGGSLGTNTDSGAGYERNSGEITQGANDRRSASPRTGSKPTPPPQDNIDEDVPF